MLTEEQKIGRRKFFKKAALAGLVGGLASTGLIKKTKASETTEPPVRWGFGIDLNRCTGCEACTIACKTENDIRLGVTRNGVKTKESGTYPSVTRKFLPWLCNHCSNPVCIKRCPVKEKEYTFTWADGTTSKYKARATYQRPDGIVLVDQDRCVGCGNCVEDCPYGVRFLDPVKTTAENTSKFVANKCTLCVHRIDKGLLPACVDTCPASARFVTNLQDSGSKVSQMKASGSVLLQSQGTTPNTYYVGLSEDFYETGDEVLNGKNKATLSRR